MKKAEITIDVYGDEVRIVGINNIQGIDDLPAEYFKQSPVFFMDVDEQVSLITDVLEIDFEVGSIFTVKMFDAVVKQMKIAGENLARIYKKAKTERRIIEI